MKRIAPALLLILFCVTTHAQQKKMDSLLTKLSVAKNIQQINGVFVQVHASPGGDALLLKAGRKNLEDAKSSNDSKKQLLSLVEICAAAQLINDPPTLLDAALQGIRLCRETKNDEYLARFFNFAAFAYILERDIRHSIDYSIYAAKLYAAKNNILATIDKYSNLETAYAELKMPDSASYYAGQELLLANRLKDSTRWAGLYAAYVDMGEAAMNMGKTDSALVYYYKGGDISAQYRHRPIDGYNENNIAKIYMQTGKPDSAIKYALEGYDQILKERRWDYAIVSTSILAKVYENRDPQKSIFYLKAQLAAQDSLTANDKIKQLQLVGDRDRQRQQELLAQQEKFNARIRLYVVVAAAFILLLVGLILWRNNRRQKQTNALLNERKEEIESQRDNLEQAYSELKVTQAQLVQSEKMASLGELTAGIAHEIQNPLNFVNNFSEVNREMLEELKAESERPEAERDAQLEIELINDLIANEEKINHHGKRADAIVKGMLQHSRISSGQKEPVDLNALADEYLRLAYHGLRAKDKDFNAELLIHFDEKLPKVDMVPQDIGRVLLNVISNAFYATRQKAQIAGAGYKPEITLSTARQIDMVTVSVKDNGVGIADAIKDKIMQPFFTTKPTGEGTGLGLSLSYDIVVMGHGGKIDIQSKEGEGAEFTVTLPVTK